MVNKKEINDEFKIASAIFAFGILLALTGLGIRSLGKKNIPLTPFSRNVNIFSLFKTYEQPRSTIYGYLPYWSINKMEYLQMDKLTDIAYFGIHINSDGSFKKTIIDEAGYEILEPGYNNWKNNEDLISIINVSKQYGISFALTIVSHNDEISTKFLECKSCWANLTANIKAELKEKNIKDVNLNFEYVEYTEGNEPQLFADFVNYINSELDREFIDSRVIVSAFADSLVKPRVSSEIEKLAQYSDGIFIMGYDFHRPSSDTAGPVAPIDGKGVHAEYDIRTMIDDYVSKVPPNKLILGVPYYGYNWVIEPGTGIYATRIEGSDLIGYSQSQAYSGVMETILETKPEVKWDELSLSPYFTYISPETGSLREVYFENKESLRHKYKLAKDNDFMGVGIWALGYDGGYTELWDLLYKEFIQ